MNEIYDALREAAGLLDAATWEKQRVARFIAGPTCPPTPFGVGDRLPALGQPHAIAEIYKAAYDVYPSGLVLSVLDVPWLWEPAQATFDYRLGSTRQALAYLRGRRLPADYLGAVPEDRHHGQCVRVGSPRTYELVFARPFPLWTR